MVLIKPKNLKYCKTIKVHVWGSARCSKSLKVISYTELFCTLNGGGLSRKVGALDLRKLFKLRWNEVTLLCFVAFPYWHSAHLEKRIFCSYQTFILQLGICGHQLAPPHTNRTQFFVSATTPPLCKICFFV